MLVRLCSKSFKQALAVHEPRTCRCTAVVVLAPESCPKLCDPIDHVTPGSSAHGTLKARILEWVAIPFSRGYSRPRDQAQVSCTTGRFFTNATHARSCLLDRLTALLATPPFSPPFGPWPRPHASQWNKSSLARRSLVLVSPVPQLVPPPCGRALAVIGLSREKGRGDI